jgi:RNA recognition motif-containing protein
MNSYQQGRGQRHGRGRSRRRGGRGRFQEQRAPAPKQKTFWQRIVAFFGNGGDTRKPAAQSSRNGQQQPQHQQPQHQRPQEQSRPSRKPESIEVTSPRLYVGNLSFDATESDLFELFNGVGHVQNAEVVSYRHNQRSKGFAFVQMQTIEEAKRAVDELHDKEFLGRKLVVSGAKSSEHSHDSHD